MTDTSRPAIEPYARRESWHCYRQLIADAFAFEFQHEPAESWFDWEGHHVHLDTWLPTEPARGTVVLIHGGGGHGRLLAPLGDRLARAGYRALAPDLPGYGITATAPGWHVDYAAWPRLVAYMADANAAPVALFGLSMGGMTALWGAQMARDVRAVIATTLIDLRDPAVYEQSARWPWVARMARLGHRWAPALTDGLALPLRLAAPLDALTGDRALQDYFRTDPLLGARRVPTRFFRTTHQFVPPRDDFALPCPLLLAHPGADVWTPTTMSRPCFDAIPSTKEFREMSNGSHLPLEQPCLRELEETVLDFFARTMRSDSPAT